MLGQRTHWPVAGGEDSVDQPPQLAERSALPRGRQRVHLQAIERRGPCLRQPALSDGAAQQRRRQQGQVAGARRRHAEDAHAVAEGGGHAVEVIGRPEPDHMADVAFALEIDIHVAACGRWLEKPMESIR